VSVPPTLLRWTCVAAFLGLAWVGFVETRRAWSHADEKVRVPGVGNAGRVTPNLYRGAQPSPEGFAALRRLGVNTIVSFTFGPDSTAREAQLVRGLGMDYVNIPWSADHEPSPDQVSHFLALLRERSHDVLFLHCWQGADRTGVMVAIYRIWHDGWSAGDAVDEMKAFHYHFLFQPHLQRFVEAFGRAHPASPPPGAPALVLDLDRRPR
jgi:protein tyrosine phosphatase (PTP) superfamily phosphohydrolase (DUF442 family)